MPALRLASPRVGRRRRESLPGASVALGLVGLCLLQSLQCIEDAADSTPRGGPPIDARQVEFLANSSITKVTVFPDCAEVTRVVPLAEFAASYARSHPSASMDGAVAVDVILEELPTSLNGTTLRVATDGPVSIAGVAHQYVMKSPKDAVPTVEGELPDDTEEAREILKHIVAAKARRDAERVYVTRAGDERRHLELAVKTGTGSVETLTAMLAPARGDDDSEGGAAEFRLLDFLGAYGKAREEIDARIAEHEAKKADITREIDLLKRKLDVVRARADRERHRRGANGKGVFERDQMGIDVIVSAELIPSQAKDASLVVTYLVGRGTAGWTPAYDVRVSSGDEAAEVELIYTGVVRQDTGEDWTATELVLSASSPSRRAVPPRLGSATARWRSQYEMHAAPPRMAKSMSYQSADRHRQMVQNSYMQNAMPSTTTLSAGSAGGAGERGRERDEVLLRTTSVSADDVFPEAGSADSSSPGGIAFATGWSLPDAVEADESSTLSSASFRISRRTTVLSNNREAKVRLAVVEAPASMTHVVVPEKHSAAFMRAVSKNTGSMPLLPSHDVSVFFDGAYVASSRMRYVAPGDQFSVYVGQDPAVKVVHSSPRATHASVSGIFSDSQETQTFKHHTVVRNSKAVPINLSLVQSLPRSEEDEIKVVLVQPALRTLDKPPHDATRLDDDDIEGDAEDAPAAQSREKAHEASGVGTTSSTGSTGQKSSAASATWLDDVTSQLTWRRVVKPGASVSIPFEYRIDWPASDDHSAGIIVD